MARDWFNELRTSAPRGTGFWATNIFTTYSIYNGIEPDIIKILTNEILEVLDKI